MGQSASKAAETARRSVAPRIRGAIEKAQRGGTGGGGGGGATSEWNKYMAERGGPTPRPDDEYSPLRGEQYQSSTDDAESGGAVPEMPPDLIKFLNDAGPLQRTVDKELTSSRVYDALAKDEGAQEEQAKQANRRVRRKMPIISSDGGDIAKEDGGGENDGTMTERTTNFSTKDRSSKGAHEAMGLGVTREDFFRLSRDVVEGVKVDTPHWKTTMEDEYRAIANKGSSEAKNFDQLKEKALFENSLKYIGVPVLMKDADGDIIGLWHHKAEDMEFGSEMKEVPDRSLQFVMLNEGVVVKEP